MPAFEIASNISVRKLIFSERHGDRFFVELTGEGIHASMMVSSHTDALGLLHWLDMLATRDAPWRGEENWSTLEGEFRIAAQCSITGNVFFNVSLQTLPGAPESWQVTAGIASERGALPRLADMARRFFLESAAQ